MQKKGQGALEYLLIIGGAVLVAAIVISLMLSSANPTKESTNQSLLDALCAKFGDSTACAAGDPDGSSGCIPTECEWNATTLLCEGAAPDSRCPICFGGSQVVGC